MDLTLWWTTRLPKDPLPCQVSCLMSCHHHVYGSFPDPRWTLLNRAHSRHGFVAPSKNALLPGFLMASTCTFLKLPALQRLSYSGLENIIFLSSPDIFIPFSCSILLHSTHYLRYFEVSEDRWILTIHDVGFQCNFISRFHMCYIQKKNFNMDEVKYVFQISVFHNS